MQTGAEKGKNQEKQSQILYIIRVSKLGIIAVLHFPTGAQTWQMLTSKSYQICLGGSYNFGHCFRKKKRSFPPQKIRSQPHLPEVSQLLWLGDPSAEPQTHQTCQLAAGFFSVLCVFADWFACGRAHWGLSGDAVRKKGEPIYARFPSNLSSQIIVLRYIRYKGCLLLLTLLLVNNLYFR